MKRALMTAASASLLIALAACSSTEGSAQTTGGGDTGEGETFELKVAHTLAVADPLHVWAEKAAERVTERSKGRLKLTVFPESQLGTFNDTLEQISSGSNLLSQQTTSFAAEYGFPEIEILAGPFLYQSHDDYLKILESDLMTEWQTGLEEEAGFKTMAWNWHSGARHIISDRGFPSPEDLEGVSIRVPSVPAYIELFDVLPTTGTPIEWAEVYSALQQGVIDAAEMPLGAYYSGSFYEQANTMTLTGHIYNNSLWVMNAELFNSYPEDLQEILVEEFVTAGNEQTAEVMSLEQDLRDRLETEHGVTFVEADHDAYVEATRDWYTRFPEWPDGLYERILEIIG